MISYYEVVIRKIEKYFGFVPDQPEYIYQIFRNKFYGNSKNFERFRYTYDYIIGLQRFSNKICKNKRYRYWDVNETARFIRLCHENHIMVVNVQPGDQQDKLNYDLDLSYLNICEVFQKLYSLDAFVGIDSCFCHGCALTGTNNITLIIDYERRQHSLKYLPLSFNYTLIPEDYDGSLICAEKVFSILYDILDNKKILSNQYKSIADRKEFVDYEYINKEIRNP